MSPGLGRRSDGCPGAPHYATPAPVYAPPYFPAYGATAHASTWLGAPLISLASSGRRAKPNERRRDRPQPPPLVATPAQPRYRAAALAHHVHQGHHNQPPRRNPTPARQAVAGADAASVASDESSGSANSEAALPRIIKPRKRRKKDRKPATVARELTVGAVVPDVDCPERRPQERATAEPERPRPCRPDAPPPYLSEASSPAYPDASGSSGSSACRCRYCEPGGRLWAEEGEEGADGGVEFAPTVLEDWRRAVGAGGARVVRRSWSDPAWRAAPPVLPEAEAAQYSLFSPRRSPLDVTLLSSEIVTSLRGHRDLEIKFFSSSPPDADTAEAAYAADTRTSSPGSARDAVKKDKIEAIVSLDDCEPKREKFTEVT